MTPCSFPQEMNQAENEARKGFELELEHILEYLLLRAVDNPFFQVHNR
jgi:hypothetical protein